MKRVLAAILVILILSSVGFSHGAEKLKAGDVDPKSGKVIKYWAAPMDPTYIRNEPGQSPMGMDLIPVFEESGGEKLPASTIKIDPVTIQNMGVRMDVVRKMPLKKSIRALGTVAFDETRIYAVNLKYNGWIEKLHVNFVGESVRRGQPLFEIYSPEMVTAQEEYLLALSQYKSLANSPYVSIPENSRRMLQAAKQRLEYWDFDNRQLEHLGSTGVVKKTLTILSPAAGVVIKKDALNGHYVEAGTHLYEIADLSDVWVDVEVYEYELPFIREGMPAAMELTYLPGKRFEGVVLFIYPFLNPETRTARLRLVFDNREKYLKPDMYANVFIESLIDPAALVVPQEAVIDSGLRKIVFVARGKGKFEPREVQLGLEGEDNSFQVLKGLSEGEEIVTSAQFMFDSESRLREAIQKMLEARSREGTELTIDDLDMDGIGMDEGDNGGLGSDDLDMEGLDMDDMKMSN